MKCAVIVVLYNYNQSNLDHIASYAPFFDQVVVVDNSDTPVAVPIPDEYHVISLGKNYGIAYALYKNLQTKISFYLPTMWFLIRKRRHPPKNLKKSIGRHNPDVYLIWKSLSILDYFAMNSLSM